MWKMALFAAALTVVGYLGGATAARATIFGGVRGIVHDPQHRSNRTPR